MTAFSVSEVETPKEQGQEPEAKKSPQHRKTLWAISIALIALELIPRHRFQEIIVRFVPVNFIQQELHRVDDVHWC
jgi:hypothetical protein